MDRSIYQRLRSDLMRLVDDFERIATIHPELGCHVLEGPMHPPSGRDMWARFSSVAADVTAEDWWVVFPGGGKCAFVPGGPITRSMFDRLATQGVAILTAIEQLVAAGQLDDAAGVKLTLPADHPTSVWLQLLLGTASMANTPRLGLLHPPGPRTLSPSERKAVNGNRRGRRILDLRVFLFSTGLLEASAEAIRIWLEPGAEVCLTRRFHGTETPGALHFVISSPVLLPVPVPTPRSASCESLIQPSSPSGDDAPATMRPRWERDIRRLTFGNKEKTFRSTAKAEMAILDEFERLGWQPSITLPAYLRDGGNGKRSAQDAVYRLSRIVGFRIETSGNYSKFTWRTPQSDSNTDHPNSHDVDRRDRAIGQT